MNIRDKEKTRIRELAEKVAECAATPEMLAIKQRWADVNGLRRPDRAPVWCRPVGCWREIISDDMRQCRTPWLRRIENRFLQILHKRDIDDDEPVDPYFTVGAVFDRCPANTWGVDIGRLQSSEQGGAWAFDPPLKNEQDLLKLRSPIFTYNQEATEKNYEQASELLDGIMPVKVTAGLPLRAGLGRTAADLRGLEQIMMDMAIAPDFMHRLMAFLREASLSVIRQFEESGQLTPNNNGPMLCSDPVGEQALDQPLTCANLWCSADSQEFDQVSPAMWEEFCLNYQKPILERFGLVSYGCCENLTHKIDGVLSIPNLRIFTCSAWTDLATVLEKTGSNLCIMWRQKASDVVFAPSLDRIRSDLDQGIRNLKGRSYQIVLRELETLGGHPDRLHQWTRLAKELAWKHG